MTKASQAVKYDVGEYQQAYQLVRDARRSIDALPGNIRPLVMGVAKTIAESVYQSCKFVHGSEAISALPDELRIQVFEILTNITEGISRACKAIYHPITDLDKIKAAGSHSDYETDKKGLEEILSLFSK